jgi:hypothetical protein
MKTEFSRKIFEKISNIKVLENAFSSSRVVPRGGRTDRQTDVKKLTVARENNKKEQVYHKNIKHAKQFLATRVHHKLRKKKVTSLMLSM